MTDTFQINLRHQIKSFEKGLITFSLVLAAVIMGGLFGIFNLNKSPVLFLLFTLTCFLYSISACYLHIAYLINNWGTILTVDKYQDEFTIKTRKQDFKYKNEDVESTELNIGIYYKNDLDNRGRWPAPWTNYGYLKVRLKDGNEFIFTSMMLD